MRKKFQKKNLIVFASFVLRHFSSKKYTYKFFARYLNPILSSFTTNEFTLKNSFVFAEDVFNYNHHLYMASRNVIVFNNPLQETMNSCVKSLFFNNVDSGKLSKSDSYNLLKLATTEWYFIFDNKLYKQTDRVAVDSLLGIALNAKIRCQNYQQKQRVFYVSFCKVTFRGTLLIVLFLIPTR